MKINFILRGTGLSGGNRAIFEITENLTEMGHEVHLVYPAIPLRRMSKSINPQRYISQAIVALKRYRETEPASWFGPTAPLKLVPTLSQDFPGLLNKFVPDADVSIATTWETAYTVAELNDNKGSKYYFIQHYEIWPLWDDPSCWEAATEKGTDPSIAMTQIVPEDKELQEYKRRVEHTYELPLSLIITSEWERQVMTRLGLSPDGSVKYGVNFDMFHPTDKGENGEVMVLAPYRNQPNKGDKEAIQAFKVLNHERSDVELAMYGTELTPEVPDFVTFYENISQDRLKDMYSRADIFVFPSWVEGFGMPPMEAMACQTALVATRVGGVPEYTPDEGVRFVPIQDSKAIVQEVGNLLDNPEEIEKMKNRNYQYIQQFTWQDTAEEFASILE